MRKVPYPTPGEILAEEFLKPLGISAYRLAKEIGVPQLRISQILAGKRAITVDTGLRLSKYFGLHDGFWTGLQLDHDAAVARDELAEVLASIKPLTAAASSAASLAGDFDSRFTTRPTPAGLVTPAAASGSGFGKEARKERLEPLFRKAQRHRPLRGR